MEPKSSSFRSKSQNPSSALGIIGSALGDSGDSSPINDESQLSSSIPVDSEPLVDAEDDLERGESLDEIETEIAIQEPLVYDELQMLYLEINESYTCDEVLELLDKTNFSYTDVEYNGSRQIKIAESDKTALQRYSESGDYVAVHFDKVRTGQEKEYVFGTLVYFSHEKFVSAFHYVSGTYWEFSKGQHSGYYINDHVTKNSFEMEYSNGNKVMTHYQPMNNKEEQLLFIHHFQK